MKAVPAEKQQRVAEFAAAAAAAHSLVAVEYTGLDANRMNELRQEARESGVQIRVLKNRLARRALSGTDYACLGEGLKGHLLLALSLEDPTAAPRLLRDFSARHRQLKVCLLALPGRRLAPEELSELADLPTLEVAAARLLGLMQQPATRLLRVLQESQLRLLRVLDAHRARTAE